MSNITPLNKKNKKLSVIDLFIWKHELPIKDRADKEIGSVYQRIPGDAYVEEARALAMQHSRAMRRELLDPTSRKYAVHIAVADDAQKDELINELVNSSVERFRDRAIIAYPTPPELLKTEQELLDDQYNVDELSSDAMLEATQAIADQVEQVKKEYTELLAKEIERMGEEYRATLESTDAEILRQQVKDLLVRRTAQWDMAATFNKAISWFSTFTDETYTTRLTESFEEFLDLPKDLIDQIVEGYISLELSQNDLKN